MNKLEIALEKWNCEWKKYLEENRLVFLMEFEHELFNMFYTSRIVNAKRNSLIFHSDNEGFSLILHSKLINKLGHEESTLECSFTVSFHSDFSHRVHFTNSTTSNSDSVKAPFTIGAKEAFKKSILHLHTNFMAAISEIFDAKYQHFFEELQAHFLNAKCEAVEKGENGIPYLLMSNGEKVNVELLYRMNIEEFDDKLQPI